MGCGFVAGFYSLHLCIVQIFSSGLSCSCEDGVGPGMYRPAQITASVLERKRKPHCSPAQKRREGMSGDVRVWVAAWGIHWVLLGHHIVQRDLKSSRTNLGDWLSSQWRGSFVWIGRILLLKRSYCHLLEKSCNNCTNLRLGHTLGLCSAQLQAQSWDGTTSILWNKALV